MEACWRENDEDPSRASSRVEREADLAETFAVLGSPVRVDLLHRLANPCFMPELVEATGLARQTLERHLDALLAAGLVVERRTRRGALPARVFQVSPGGLFAFKEHVRALAIDAPPEAPRIEATKAAPDAPASHRDGRGLLLVHGDRPGRWFPLDGRAEWVLGRDANADVPLPYDSFASAKHALLRRAPAGWTITDLGSTNGSFVNFARIPPGLAHPARPGDLLTIGRSQLLLRDGP